MHWLDKYVKEQEEQTKLFNRITAPYDTADLCELITEQDETQQKETSNENT